MTYFKIFIPLMATALLVFACGSDSTGPSGGGTTYGTYSLGWGQDLADPVRDAQLPNGDLFAISCVDINDEGNLEFGIPWQFYYVDPADTTSMLIVMVLYTRNTTYLWEDSSTVYSTELPDYNDAGPWVDAARDSMGPNYDDWEEYALTVVGNPYTQFPWVSNVAILQFMSADTTDQASVILDADDNQVLQIIDY